MKPIIKRLTIINNWLVNTFCWQNFLLFFLSFYSNSFLWFCLALSKWWVIARVLGWENTVSGMCQECEGLSSLLSGTGEHGWSVLCQHSHCMTELHRFKDRIDRPSSHAKSRSFMVLTKQQRFQQQPTHSRGPVLFATTCRGNIWLNPAEENIYVGSTRKIFVDLQRRWWKGDRWHVWSG